MPSHYNRYLLCLVLLCSALQGRAALPGPPTYRFHARSWSVEQGLPQVTAQAVAQDNQGFIWAGTQDGLARFDGVRFKVFSPDDYPALGDHYINALLADGQRLWIGTSTGLALYRRGRISRLSSATGAINTLVKADGKGIWIGSQDGLFYVSGDTATLKKARQLEPQPVYSLFLDRHHQLWIGVRGGAFVGAPGHFRFKPLPNPALRVTAFAEHDGRVWLGTTDGLYISSPQGIRTYHSPILNKFSTRALCQDHSGHLWIGTEHGLYRLSAAQGLEDFRAIEGLGRLWVRALTMDREGNLWVGSSTHGLVRLWNNNIVNFGPQSELAGKITWAIYGEADGGIWIGTHDGIYQYKKGSIRPRFDTAKLPDPMVIAFVRDDKRRLWIGTLKGLMLAEHGHLVSPTGALRNLPHTTVYGLMKGHNGAIWISTREGLYRYLAGNLRHFGKQDGLPEKRVSGTYQFNGAIWAATDRGAYVSRKGRFRKIGQQVHLDTSNVDIMYRSQDGSIWIGTRHGLVRYRHGKFTRYFNKDGLHTDMVFFITGDNHGDLWLTSHKGIARFRIADFDAFDAGKIHHLPVRLFSRLDSTTKIQATGGIEQPGFADREGNLWVPTIRGVVVVNMHNLPFNAVPPLVAIEAVRTNRHTYTIGRVRGRVISLPAGSGDISFVYAGLSYTDPAGLRFAYKLEGYDNDWLEVGARREAYYTNLAPGHYLFKIKARNYDGVASAHGAELAIVLEPFFYQTAWFDALCALFALGMLYGAYRWRMRRSDAQRAALEATVSQRTVELREANRRLATASLTDTLTGLKNRRYLTEHIDKDLAQTRRAHRTQNAQNKDIVFFIIDVDDFKKINDTYGHQAGDRLLVQMGEVFSGLVKESDYVIRWGGEEFLIVTRQTEHSEAPAVAERLRKVIAEQVFAIGGGRQIKRTCSIGFCAFPVTAEDLHSPSWDEVLVLADLAMYRAKALGKNAWVGLQGTDQTRLSTLAERAKNDLDALVDAGELIMRTSVREPEAS